MTYLLSTAAPDLGHGVSPSASCCSNLPWLLVLKFQVPSSIALYSIGLSFHQQSHPDWLLFLLWLCLFILSGVSSPLFSVACWAPTGLGSSSFSVLSFLLFILFMGFSRGEYWSVLPFPSPVDHILSDLSTMTHPLGWPHMTWLNFIELGKAMVRVIRLASCPWLWFQSVCPLMPSLSAYPLTWVSLTLDVRYLFMAERSIDLRIDSHLKN